MTPASHLAKRCEDCARFNTAVDPRGLLLEAAAALRALDQRRLAAEAALDPPDRAVRAAPAKDPAR